MLKLYGFCILELVLLLNCFSILYIGPQYKCLIPKILKLVSSYTVICRYSEENRQNHNGYVNQALACYLNKFIRDYLVCFNKLYNS